MKAGRGTRGADLDLEDRLTAAEVALRRGEGRGVSD